MSNIDQSSGPDNGENRNSLLRASFGGIAFVLLILLMMYVGNRLKTIEDELDHCAPATTYGIDMSKSQVVYAPVYTHITTNGGESQPLDVILGIRNSDPEHPITITSARFYDGKGNLVREYLDDGPIQLAPLEARSLTMAKSDLRDAATAANFIVAWKSDLPVYEPIIDAIMFTYNNEKSFSFKSVGRPLSQRIDE